MEHWLLSISRERPHPPRHNTSSPHAASRRNETGSIINSDCVSHLIYIYISDPQSLSYKYSCHPIHSQNSELRTPSRTGTGNTGNKPGAVHDGHACCCLCLAVYIGLSVLGTLSFFHSSFPAVGFFLWVR